MRPLPAQEQLPRRSACEEFSVPRGAGNSCVFECSASPVPPAPRLPPMLHTSSPHYSRDLGSRVAGPHSRIQDGSNDRGAPRGSGFSASGPGCAQRGEASPLEFKSRATPAASPRARSSCRRISMAEYDLQRREYTRDAVALLMRSKEYRQYVRHREMEERFQYSWILGPVLLVIITYFDFMCGYTRTGALEPFFGYTITSLPDGPLRLLPAAYVLLVCAPLCYMAPWCGFYSTFLSRPELADAVSALTATACIVACVPALSLHRPPFIVTQPPLEHYDDALACLLAFAQRLLPLLSPGVAGYAYFRLKANIWRPAWNERFPLVHAACFVGLTSLLLWRYILGGIASLVGRCKVDGWAAALLDPLLQDIRVVQMTGGPARMAFAAASSASIYCWVLLGTTFVLAPFLRWLYHATQGLLPRRFSSWLLLQGVLLAGLAYIHSTSQLTVPIAVAALAMMITLLVNGFDVRDDCFD